MADEKDMGKNELAAEHALEELMKRAALDVEEAREALAEAEKTGAVTLEEFKKELGEALRHNNGTRVQLHPEESKAERDRLLKDAPKPH
jgi:hypothetical protein